MNQTILSLLCKQDMDGYCLKQKSNLETKKIQKTVQSLVKNNKIKAAGNIYGTEKEFLESWFQIV